MSKNAIRVLSREFKLKIVRRMLAGENVSALARELKVLRKDLYVWRKRFRSGGPEALRGRGHPSKADVHRTRQRSRRASIRQGEAIFVDSGAWIALALLRDPPHARELRNCSALKSLLGF
jgi:transposase-like protein